MENETIQTVDPSERKGNQTRALAGKALVVFVLLMVALTWASRMLEEMTIATVTTTNMQRGALEKQVRQSGTLVAFETVPVLASESARVLEVYKKAGASVTEGEPLFQLDYTDAVKKAYDTLQTAQTAKDKKQQTLDWAAADLGASTVNRILQRVDNVASLEKQYYEEEAAFQKLQNPSQSDGNRLSQRKNAYETEKRMLDADTTARDYRQKLDDLADAVIELETKASEFADITRKLDSFDVYDSSATYTMTAVAPVTGTVLECGLTKGSMSSTTNPAMTLSNQAGGLSLTVYIDEDSAAEMAVGDTARITVGTQRYDAPILSLATSADRQGMVEATFRLEGSSDAPGMSAEMYFSKRTQNYDIIIPLGALRHDSDGDFVYVVKQQEGSLGARMSVSRVDVYVLDQDSGRAALQSGLTQRDIVVERSDRSLSDGDRVRLAEE